jgi:Kef-type K+ transport system membrane component KefB
MLVYALAAELVGGVAAITGSFLAGLMFSRTQDKIEIESKIRSLAYGFFVPIFFISIGLTIDLGSLKPSSLTPFIVITLIAIVGKILGAGLGSRIGGFNWKEATQFGIGMTSRGEVGLIIAQVGITEAILNNELFSSLVGMVLVTTILTPPMLRAAFAGSDPAGHPPPLPVLPAESPEEP